jgi:hypothetical protein
MLLQKSLDLAIWVIAIRTPTAEHANLLLELPKACLRVWWGVAFSACKGGLHVRSA